MDSRRRRTRSWSAGLVLLVLGTASGCSSDDLNSATAVKLRGLANLYLDCAVGKNGTGPAHEQEFKKHLRGLPGFVLQMQQVDPNAIDALFVSERDREPFVIRYGVSIGGISGNSAPLLAHEKTGKNGKRLVVYVNTRVEVLDESSFQKLSTARP